MARLSKATCQTVQPLAIVLVAVLLRWAGRLAEPADATLRLAVESDRDRSLQFQSFQLRFKGDRDRLLAFILAQIPSLLSVDYGQNEGDRSWLVNFLSADSTIQREQFNNALRCLYQQQILKDCREDRDNTPYRHFTLKLDSSPLASDRPGDIIRQLFKTKTIEKSPDQPDQSSVNPSSVNLSSVNLNIRWLKLLPQNLYSYTPNRLKEIALLLPELEQLRQAFCAINSDQIFLVYKSLICFYLAEYNLEKASLFLQQFGQSIESQASRITLANLQEIEAIYQHYNGVYAYQAKHLVQAQLSFTKALEIREQLYTNNGKNTKNTEVSEADAADQMEILADTLHNLACVERDLQHFDRSESLFHRAIQLRRHLNSDTAAEGLASSLMQFGHLRSEQGYFAEAAKIYDAVQLRFGILLKKHPLVASLAIGLGHLQAKQGHYAAATEHYEKAIVCLTELYGKNNPQLAIPQASLAAIRDLQF